MLRPSQPGRDMPSSSQDAQAVVNWRRLELIHFGFPRSLAARVARDERYDLHQLIELVEQGCTPDLAVRILSSAEDHDAT
jgi:hypothetical protein